MVDTEYISPICLPEKYPLSKNPFLGVKCVAVGWGMRLRGARLENTLKEIWVPVVENSDCSEMYGMQYNIPVRKYHLCAGSTKGGIGTCVVSRNISIINKIA